jgi:adenylate kinase family enzyme
MMSPLDKPIRINVIGTTGSGKSTLARRLSHELSIPDIELDELFWQPNWVGTPNEEFLAKVKTAIHATDSWVLHGNYSRTRPLVWTRATHILWLDYPPPFIFARLLKRTLRRSFTKEPMWAGNTESFSKAFLSRDSILMWFFKTYKNNRKVVPSLLEQPEYRHLQLLRLTSPSETSTLLTRLLDSKGVRDATTA